MLLSTPSAGHERSPQARLQTNGTSFVTWNQPLDSQMQPPGKSQPPCCWKVFFGPSDDRAQPVAAWRGGAFEVRLPSCPRHAWLTAIIPNNISWRQSFLGNKSVDHCNLCNGLPRGVSPCKYVGIKEYIFLAPDMETNSVMTVNQQSEDPWQTNMLPGSTPCPFPPAREAPVPTQTGSCCIEGDCPKLTHSRRSNRKHSFFSEPVAVLLLLRLWAFDKNEKRSKTNLCFPFLSAASTVGNNGSLSCLAY